jgi:predicted transcriptional regulator
MNVDPEFYDSLNFLYNDKTARRVFETIAQQLGVSGWMIAKQSNQDPNEIAGALSQLDKMGIVKSSGPELEGNYVLTPLGFSLRERLLAGSQSRA